MRAHRCIFIFYVISLFFLSLDVFGVNTLHFYNLNNEYNLSIRETNQVLSDDYGFVWISSKMGIIRYSHDDISIYQLPYESVDVITVKLIYFNESLYAYTNNGQLFKYNFIFDEFEMYVNISKELNNPFIVLHRALIDYNENIWFATSFGLIKYNDESGVSNVLVEGNIFDIEWIDDQHFIFAKERQISTFDSEELSHEVIFSFPEKTNYAVSRLYYDADNEIYWIGTVMNGLLYLKRDKQNNIELGEIHGTPLQPIMAIEAYTDSSIFIGVDGQGLWEIDTSNFNVANVYKDNSSEPNSLKGNGVYDVYCDRDNRVWICTFSGGVSYFDKNNLDITVINHTANNINSLVNNDVNAICEDSDGNFWFATNNGISIWDVNKNVWSSLYFDETEHAQVFNGICVDNIGRIWAGTYSSGVYLIDRKTRERIDHLYFDKSSSTFNNNFVLDIYKDSKGNIWIGGAVGDLLCYLSDEDRFIVYENFSVKVIKEFCAGQILIGSTIGLHLLDTESGNVKYIVDGYIVNDIFVIDSTIWLCTSGNGVLEFDYSTGLLNEYTIESGLPSNFVNSIIYANGFFWFGTEHGLAKFDETSNVFTTFYSYPSLSNVSFNPNACFLSGDGRLYWGTNKGILSFYPNIDPLSIKQGQIFFQDIAIMGRSIRNTAIFSLEYPLNEMEELRLKHNQNSISIELIPIGVSMPGSKFSWKIEGINEVWTTPSQNSTVNYSNIPRGTNKLELRMYDNSLSNLIDERTLLIYVTPPFWDTWWFRLIVISLIPIIGFYQLYYYVVNLKKRHVKEKIRFFIDTNHDMRTSLTLIGGPVGELKKEIGLTEKGKYYLNIISGQVKHLTNVTSRLMDMHKVGIGKEQFNLSMVNVVNTIQSRIVMFESYAQSRNIDLDFKANCTDYETAIDEVLIEKVIDNLISNSIKYSNPNTVIRVSLKCTSKKWILEVKDQGIGISKDAKKKLFREYYRGENAINSRIMGSGIGLLLVKNYLNMHEGNIKCNSQLNVGSTFIVTVPFRKVEKENIEEHKSDNILTDNNHLSEAVPSSINVDNIAKSKTKVLIVEDNDNLCEFLQMSMSEKYCIKTASNGENAWEMLMHEMFDLVISDVVMPKMDGFELCSKMKSNYETSHIPIILLTALSGKAKELKGLGLGADDYLTKPFDVSLLQRRVDSIIRNREIIRDKALKILKPNENEALSNNELNNDFLKQIIEVVNQNIDNCEFSRNDFARAMGISPSLLYKKVKALTNQSPSDFIRYVRLNHAIELLQTKNYSVIEVSELCGFSNVSYFSSVFRKHYGKSPSQIT